MTDLLWPGDERAGGLLSDAAVLAAMARVEQAWLDALVDAGLAPKALDLVSLVGPDDVTALAAGAEGGGNPVIGLVSLLKERAVPPGAVESDAAWIHRGLTSQDVVDTALMLAVRDALDRIAGDTRSQIDSLVRLVGEHRATPMVGRTLTQHAVPTTFGLVAAGWLDGVLDVAEEVDRVRGDLPAQIGGAVGTLAASSELARLAGLPDPASTSVRLAQQTASALGLAAARPWHVRRRPITRVGDALVAATDVWGQVATDVVTLSRPEIGELAEPSKAGRGGSSTMPQKQNPILSVLLRRAALAAPPLAATLHTAAALAADQRPDGSWHAEWDTLRTLARRAVVASDQARELLDGLRVDAGRMRANLDAAGDAVLAERDGIRRLASDRWLSEPASARRLSEPASRNPDPASRRLSEPASRNPAEYLGATDLFVDTALARARTFLEEPA